LINSRCELNIYKKDIELKSASFSPKKPLNALFYLTKEIKDPTHHQHFLLSLIQIPSPRFGTQSYIEDKMEQAKELQLKGFIPRAIFLWFTKDLSATLLC